MPKLQFFSPNPTITNNDKLLIATANIVNSFRNLNRDAPKKTSNLRRSKNALTPKTNQKFPQIPHCLTPNSTLIYTTNKIFLSRFPLKKLKSFLRQKGGHKPPTIPPTTSQSSKSTPDFPTNSYLSN